MSIGKKIGGGFCSIIFLMLVLGFIAIRSMSESTSVSQNLADDRILRFIDWTSLQRNLLNAEYSVRVYLEDGDEANIRQAFDYLRYYKEALADIKRLNSVIYFKKTASIIEKAEKDIVVYEDLVRKTQAMSGDIRDTMLKMMNTGRGALAGISALLNTMGETQLTFIEHGDSGSAVRSLRNLVDATALYEDVSTMYSELLMAERNNDMPLFEEIRQRLQNIAKKVEGSTANSMLHEGFQKPFIEAVKKCNEFFSVAEALATYKRALVDTCMERNNQFSSMFADATDMVGVTTKNTSNIVTESARSLSASTTVVTIMLCVLLVLGIIVSVIITRMLTKPLTTTQIFAQDVAAGHMDKELEVHTTDEIGRLADALRSMVTVLKRNIFEAQAKAEQAQKATEETKVAMAQAEEAARKAETAKRDGMLHVANELEGVIAAIASASSQLSAQIEQSNQGTGEVASRLSEAATAMNEMTATVQEVARNAASAAQISSETREQALNGADVVMKSRESTHLVREVTLTLKNDMAELDSHAKAINNIMGVISDIADQTNLLALNAAIEAARAGEAGRGFAVVADEVRKLAEKTMASTQEVSGAILAIQGSMEKSLKAMDDAFVQIEKTTELAEHAGQALEAIVRDVESASDQTSAIAAASEEQSAAGDEINKSITFISESVNNVALAMDESTKAVRELANQAQGLSRLVENMKAEA